MKKTLMILGVLFIAIVVYGATKKISELDLATSLSSTDRFLVTRDSSSTDVSNGFTWKTLVNGTKDSIEVNGLDSLNTVGTLSTGGNTDITGTLVVSDSITSVGLGTSGDIQVTGSKQIYGTVERFIAVVYFATPDTLETDTAYVVDNFLGATVTVDSIRIEHNADSLSLKIYRKDKGTSTRITPYTITTMTQTDTVICFQTATLPHGSTFGFGESTGGDTTPTFIKVTFIGQYTKAKLQETGRTCDAQS